LQKHAELFLIDRRAAYRRVAPIRRLNKSADGQGKLKSYQNLMRWGYSWVTLRANENRQGQQG
jgi:hypothetical protein